MFNNSIDNSLYYSEILFNIIFPGKNLIFDFYLKLLVYNNKMAGLVKGKNIDVRKRFSNHPLDNGSRLYKNYGV